MKRIAPNPKDKPVSFNLPKMESAINASDAAGSALNSVSKGDLTPIEATRVMGLIDSYGRTLELTEIENRRRLWKLLMNSFKARLKRLDDAKLPTKPPVSYSWAVGTFIRQMFSNANAAS